MTPDETMEREYRCPEPGCSFRSRTDDPANIAWHKAEHDHEGSEAAEVEWFYAGWDAGQSNVADEIERLRGEVERLRGVMNRHAEQMHPDYGPCDELGEGGACAACLGRVEQAEREVERLRRNLRMWEEERHPTLVSSRAATAKRAAEIDRLEEVNAKHVLNRIEIEGQFKDLRTRAEQAERERDEARALPKDCQAWARLYKKQTDELNSLREALGKADKMVVKWSAGDIQGAEDAYTAYRQARAAGCVE